MTSPSLGTAPAQTLMHGVCTHVLVSLTLRGDADLQRAMSVMREEMIATAELYMDGKILQWFSQLDERGVLLLFATSDLEETRSLMSHLPLVAADLVDLHFTRLGPLQPLKSLLPSSDSR